MVGWSLPELRQCGCEVLCERAAPDSSRFDAYILEMKTVSAFLRRVAVRPSLHRFRPELKPLKGIDVSSTMDLLLRPRRAAVDAANIRSGTPCRVRRVASRQPVAKQSQKRTMRMTADVP